MKKWVAWLIGGLVVGGVVYGGIRWFFPDEFVNTSTLSEYVEAIDDSHTTFLVKEAAGIVQVTSRMPGEEKSDWLSNEDLVDAYTGDWQVSFAVQNTEQTAVISLKDDEALSQDMRYTNDLTYAAYIPYPAPDGNEVGLFVSANDRSVIDAIKKAPKTAETYKDKAEIRYVGIETE